ncbi:MAG: hypothetical protein WD989_01210 [Candidatus Paceibacterota bacterium]
MLLGYNQHIPSDYLSEGSNEVKVLIFSNEPVLEFGPVAKGTIGFHKTSKSKRTIEAILK